MRLFSFFSLWLVAVAFFLAWADSNYLFHSLVLFLFILLFTLVNPFRHAGWAAATIANLAFAYLQISQKGGSTLVLSLVVIVEALFYITVWLGNSTVASLPRSRTSREGKKMPPLRMPKVLSGNPPPTPPLSSFPLPIRAPGESVIAFVGMEIDQIEAVKGALEKKLDSDSIRLFFYSEGVTAFAVIADANSIAHHLVQLDEIPIENVTVNHDWVEVDLI